MAGLIAGYEYDIFISYRQKDNKGDKWVSEFVEALKSELDATIKDDISIYFDENPHDGLLETHDVDESLKERLKSLIFIPVISRTYCDTKSFAWQHEFIPFVDLASADSIGLKVKLPNGNVASRVLPVRIHEIEPDDHRLCESVLGGAIRGVDFIYKSAGVNRPLMRTEEYPQNNLNKTYYRDQINKVANAVDEILHALRKPGTPEQTLKHGKINETVKKEGSFRLPDRVTFIRNRKWLLLILFIICAAGAFLIYSLFDSSKPGNTVAVLPFRCEGDGPELTARSDIISELSRTKLEKLPGVSVRSRISTSAYRGSGKSLKTIRKELDINYLVDGTLRLLDGTTVIWINIVDARNDRQLWSGEYKWDSNLVSGIAAEVAREFALRCKISLNDEQLSLVEQSPTSRADAYLNFISANVTYNDAWSFFNSGKIVDSEVIEKSVDYYDRAIELDSLFAEAYARRAIAYAWGYYTGQFDTAYIAKCNDDITTAFRLNSDLEDAIIAKGFFYYYCKQDYGNALECFKKISEINPADYQPLYYMALIYRRMGEWNKSQNLVSRVIGQNPQVSIFLTNIGLSYQYLHKPDSAVYYHEKAIEVSPGWSSPYVNKIESLFLIPGRSREAAKEIDRAEKNTGRDLSLHRIRLDLYNGKIRDALRRAQRYEPEEIPERVDILLMRSDLYRLTGDRLKSVMCCKTALKILKDNKKDHLTLVKESLAYAGIENASAALEKISEAMNLAYFNSMELSDIRLVQARVFTMTGDYDSALTDIEFLLDNPSMFSVHMFRTDPCWKPLLDTERGRRLLDKYTDRV